MSSSCRGSGGSAGKGEAPTVPLLEPEREDGSGQGKASSPVVVFRRPSSPFPSPLRRPGSPSSLRGDPALELPTGHAHTLDPAARRFPPRLQNPFPATLPCSRSLQTRTARLKKLKPPKRTPGGQPGLWKPEAGSRESSSGNRAAGIWHPNSEIENGTAVRAIVRTVQRKNIRTITERSIEEVKEVYLPTD